MKKPLLFGLSAVLATSSASAQVLLNETFNAENGGNTFLNYNTFANMSVNGQVDLVKSGDFGITCLSGACVDLDGTSGPGSIKTLSAFAFNPGDIMRITFGLSGNQRDGNFDNIFLSAQFAGGALLNSYLGTGGLNFVSGGPLFISGLTASTSILGTTPFSTWTFEFLAGSAGTVQYEIGTTSSDNVGPLLDDVMVERITGRSVVPEPSTWAMLSFGLGAVGVVARRRARRA